MILESSVFRNGETIPVRYSGEGKDISPPLEWSKIPDGVKQFAMICEDPDAHAQPSLESTFVHWLIYNIPADVLTLPENLGASENILLPFKANQGMNSFGKIGFSGPMPPVGAGFHHYIFTLCALGEVLDLEAGMLKNQLLEAIDGHVVATAKLVGLYKREAGGLVIDVELKKQVGASQRYTM